MSNKSPSSLEKKLDLLIEELCTTNLRLTQLEERMGKYADIMAGAKEEIVQSVLSEVVPLVDAKLRGLPCSSGKSNGSGERCQAQ